ncbi:MAG TPA: hypothetical protein VN780_00820 [Candidatus Eisenbacteria bacterium]|nr:hypothetical protein [Candidatus Eisenbacteria bacterium]
MSRYFDNYWKKEFKSMASRSHKHAKTESLLVNLAESIGSTLGTLAAKADAAQKALAKSDIISNIERNGKKLVRRTKAVAGAAKRKASRKVAGTKSAAGRTARGLKRNASRKAKSTRVAPRRAAKAAKHVTSRQARGRARK